MITVKKICFSILVFLLCLPAVQDNFSLFSSNSLDGYQPSEIMPVFTTRGFFDCSFQDSLTPYIESRIPFKSDLVRLFNQIDFSLFGVPHAHKIIVGKNNYLFEEPYIKAYLGHDFFGRQKIEARVSQFKELQELLWNEKKILMLVIFAPDKGSFYSEKIPDRYLKARRDTTNYQWYKQGLEKAGVNFIDFNAWFLKIKDTSRFMLYPKTGIHWSSYGAYLAMDSLMHYLSRKLETPMTELVLDSIENSRSARSYDKDIYMALNLIWNIPHPPLAYPHFHYRETNTEKKPSALFIGDSFYFCWSEPGYIKNIFSNEEFWYYDHDVYLNGIKQKEMVSDLNLQASIDRQKVIVFIQTNAGYGNAGYWFVDRVLALMRDTTQEVK